MAQERQNPATPRALFVGYPFSLGDAYKDELRRAFAGSGIDVVAANDRIENSHILEKIRRMVAASNLAVFDLTENNPNVALELGIAIGAGHPYIVVIQRAWVGQNRLLSDLAGWDSLRYDSLADLGRTLRSSIEQGRTPFRDTSALPPSVPVVRAAGTRREPEIRRMRIDYGRYLVENIGDHFGSSGRPADVPAEVHTLDARDNEFIATIIRRVPGCAKFTVRGVNEGIIASDVEPVDVLNFGLATNGIYITQDGQMRMRFAAFAGAHVFYDLFRAISAPFYLARQLFNRFGWSSRYSFGFGYRLTAETYPPGILAQPYPEDGHFEADVARMSFGEACVDAVMYCLRGGNRGDQLVREDLSAELDDFWRRNYGA